MRSTVLYQDGRLKLLKIDQKRFYLIDKEDGSKTGYYGLKPLLRLLEVYGVRL